MPGGLDTDLLARGLMGDGQRLGNGWAAGEVAGFRRIYRPLAATFLGGGLFSGGSPAAVRPGRSLEPTSYLVLDGRRSRAVPSASTFPLSSNTTR